MKYTKKAGAVEAITFDELVKHGIEQGVPLTNGMPWSFAYGNKPVTHENDFTYIIGGTLRFTSGQMLVTHPCGSMTTCSLEVFENTYEPAAPETKRGI